MSSKASANRAWIAFEWAVIRLVPRVHVEEFVQVGVVLHARTVEFLDARIYPGWDRVTALAPELDRDVAQRHLDAFLRVCRGDPEAGPVALLPPSERFHWLTAPRSAVVQTSPVHPGRCRDPGTALDHLFAEQCR